MKKAIMALVVAGLSLVVLSGEAKADKYSQFKGSWGGHYNQSCYGPKQFGGYQGGYQGGCIPKPGCGYQGGYQSGYQGGYQSGYQGGCVGKQGSFGKQFGGYSQKQY